MSGAGVILIAGPTAGGKSAAAIDVARKTGGEIVNADAMQVYKDLRILTARPSQDEVKTTPHHLYGVIDGAEHCSAGRWARMAADIVNDILARGRSAIVVGGTGLYFRALEDGLSPIPETPVEIRSAAKARLEKVGAKAFRDEVIARDQAMARLPEGDSQRLIRAWEVFEATGKPLSYYQALPRQPFIDEANARIVIEPTREALYARCDARAKAMFKEGAVEEVRSLTARHLDPSLPVMKALGVAEISAYLGGETTPEETLAALQQSTRRFAKRQLTWFRNQAPGWPRADSGADAAKKLLSRI